MRIQRKHFGPPMTLLRVYPQNWGWCVVDTVESYTRMESKVMPLANFHRNCWREDKTHALYVFSILSPFNRCINCTCRHNILGQKRNAAYKTYILYGMSFTNLSQTICHSLSADSWVIGPSEVLATTVTGGN